jgi:hypothetical protein
MGGEMLARAWMAQWRRAGVALAELRIHDLRALTDEEARTAALALLELGALLPVAPERERSSGLVRQQALLHRKRSPA